MSVRYKVNSATAATRRGDGNRARSPPIATGRQCLISAQKYFGALYHRWKARLETLKALTAVALKLARILWHLFKYGEAFSPEVFRLAEVKMQPKKLTRLHQTTTALGLKRIAIH